MNQGNISETSQKQTLEQVRIRNDFLMFEADVDKKEIKIVLIWPSNTKM